MIKLKQGERYITDVKHLRGCSFKIEKDITMRPICSYASNGIVILICNKIGENSVEFSEFTTGYIVYGCNNLVKKEIKIPGVTPDNHDQVIDDIKNQNHLWISLEDVDEATPEAELEFINSLKSFTEENEVDEALGKLDEISLTNIMRTVTEVEKNYNESSSTPIITSKNGNKKLGQLTI